MLLLQELRKYMAKIIGLNKPFGVVCQFSGQGDTLAKYIDIPNIYPVGRLDKDSEGLVILTDDGLLQHKISNPKYNKIKTYVVQLDGEITQTEIQILKNGVRLKDGLTKPAKVQLISQPKWLWDRVPPIRERRSIPTSWIEISITEGRNRQVRRMTAKVGFPTLRLVRTRVGEWHLNNLLPGSYATF